MSTSLPVTFTASPLPSTFRGGPQQLLDAIVARLGLTTDGSLQFYASGSVAPTSDVGPWLKDNLTWWVWDVGTGAYVPEVIDSLSLRYILSVATPDPAEYDVWFVLDGAGKAQAVKTYSAGAWHDVYEDKFATYSTTTEVNALIAAALIRYPAAAYTSGSISVPCDATPTKVSNFDQVELDPNSAYNAASARYVAQVTGVYSVTGNVQVDNDTGTASGMEIGIFVSLNGSTTPGNTASSGTSAASPPGSRWYPEVQGMLEMSAGDYIEIWMTANDGVGSGQVTVANGDWGIQLVQKA